MRNSVGMHARRLGRDCRHALIPTATFVSVIPRPPAYNGFCAWVAFGGDRLLGGIDTESYEKRVKYTDLLANALILYNVVDMSVALERLAARGYLVTPETVSHLSPYTTRNWKRFGEYAIPLTTVPPPLTTLTHLFQQRFGDTLTRLSAKPR